MDYASFIALTKPGVDRRYKVTHGHHAAQIFARVLLASRQQRPDWHVRGLTNLRNIASHATLHKAIAELERDRLVKRVPVPGQYPLKRVTLTARGLKYAAALDLAMSDYAVAQ